MFFMHRRNQHSDSHAHHVIHTHTHIHTHIYIYIYIYDVCLQQFVFFSSLQALFPVVLYQMNLGVLTLWHFHKNIRSCVENECCCPRKVNSKRLVLIVQMVRAFGMNPKVGGSSPLRSRYFLSQKFWHFHKNIRSCVENECFCPQTVDISNVDLTSKINCKYV